MPINLTCACGKKLSVKDELAGKRLKCPACQSTLAIPKPMDHEASSDDPGEMEDSVEDDDSALRRKRSSGSRRSAANENRGQSQRGDKRKGGKKQPPPKRNSLLIGLLAGGGFLVVILLVWTLWPPKKAENIAANPGGDAAPNPGTTMTTEPALVTAANPSSASQVVQLPRAMTQLPDWLIQDAPFDVKQFWITLPPAENAAPLYLDALYEFSPELEACFPPEIRVQQTATVKARYDRFHKLLLNWDAHPTPQRDPAERDAVLQEYVVAFQKLAQAQKRPRCVFEVGWDVPSMALLMLSLVEASRVAELQVERDIERGDFDAVVRMTGSMLRLSRDLRPRTPQIFQSVGDVLEGRTFENMVIPALKSPGLKVSQCDELLQLLAQHEAALRAVDPFLTSVRGEYLFKRMLLHDVQQQLGDFSASRFPQAFGTTNESRGAALMSALNGDAAMSAKFGTEPPPGDMGKILDFVIQNMKPADFDTNAAYLKEKYRILADSVAQPYSARASTFNAWIRKYQQETPSELREIYIQFADIIMSQKTTSAQMDNIEQTALEKKLASLTLRGPLVAVMLTSKFENDMGNQDAIYAEIHLKTRLQATMALIALRRWYGTHADSPSDIVTMCREAGLPNAPRDFFTEGPLRMATFAADTPIQHPYLEGLKVLAGETVIYSVGPDGVDDKGLKDDVFTPNGPGDWLFRLEIPQSAIPVTPAPPAAPISVLATVTNNSFEMELTRALQQASGKLEAMKVYSSLEPWEQFVGAEGPTHCVMLALPETADGTMSPELWAIVSSISHVFISTSFATNATLRQLAQHPGLLGINISTRSTVTTDGIAALKACPQLRHLMFFSVPVSPEVCEKISQMGNLRYLGIQDAPVSKEMLGSIVQLSQLEVLSLQKTGTTDDDALEIQKLTKLKTLYLCDSQLTDEGLKALTSLMKLRTLFLDNSKVTDEGLTTLKSFTGLTQLFVRGLKVTPQGLADLEASLPNCEVFK